MNIYKINTSPAFSARLLCRFLQLTLVSAICFIAFVSPTMAQNVVQEGNSCNRPDFDRTTDTGIFIWQLCSTKQWFLRVSAGGLPSNVELRVIGNLRLSKPIASITPFSLASNDILDASDPENIKINFRVFIEAQDGFDFELEEGTVACLSLSNTIDAPIVIGAQNIVVTSPINIDSADKTLCIGGTVVPPISYLLLEDNL